jgi:ATP-binding cassette subfamily B protein
MVRRSCLVRVYSLARRRLPAYSLALVLAAVADSFLQIARGGLVQTMFDAVVRRDLDGVLSGALAVGGTLAVLITVRTVLKLTYESAAASITGDLRKAVFRHLQRLPVSYHDRVHSGDIVSRLTNDIEIFEPAYRSMPASLASQVAAGIGALGYILRIDWRLATMAAFSGFLFALPGLLSLGRLRRTGMEVQRRLGKVTERLSDILSGAVVIRTYSAQDEVMEQYREDNGRALLASLSQVRLQAGINSLSTVPVWIGQIGLLALGTYMAMRRLISIGEALGAFSVYMPILSLFSPLRTAVQYQQALAGGDRVMEIFSVEVEPYAGSTEPEVKHVHAEVRKHALSPQPTAQRVSLDEDVAGALIDFSDVEFSYDSADEDERRAPLLNGVSFKIHRGEKVALVGPSGSGKTTIMRLLLGLYRPCRGKIRVAGYSADEHDLREIRELLAHVPQDGFLFADTIKENIRFGRPDASDEEIIEAAKAANAHDFISAFPKGYETLVGERGAQISGGQRQRIAIARAVLRNPQLLLLDEATSALDSESERLVNDALKRLMAGRTTLVVAHRLSTVLDADRVMVLDSGRIVQSGTHDELIADAGGLYRRLCELQFSSRTSSSGHAEYRSHFVNHFGPRTSVE